MKCVECGEEFEGKSSKSRFCGNKCQRKWYLREEASLRPKVVRTCPVCGKDFEGKKKRKYCSEVCSYRVKLKQAIGYYAGHERPAKERTRGERRCKYCGESFIPKRDSHVFCSDYCNGAFHRSLLKAWEPREAVCARCGKGYTQLEKAQKYCGAVCKLDANREQSREYQRRRRENGLGSVSVDGVPEELPDSLFERCTECDREFVRSEKAKGRCPMCRGIYNVKRESWTNEVMWRS